MNLFNRLPGFTRTPAGSERVVLRRLPRTLLLGTLLLALLMLGALAVSPARTSVRMLPASSRVTEL